MRYYPQHTHNLTEYVVFQDTRISGFSGSQIHITWCNMNCNSDMAKKSTPKMLTVESSDLVLQHSSTGDRYFGEPIETDRYFYFVFLCFTA